MAPGQSTENQKHGCSIYKGACPGRRQRPHQNMIHQWYQFPSTLFMWMARSTKRLEYPHSLSYQVTNLTKLSFNAMPAPTSKTDEALQVTKSVETTSSSVHSKTPCIGPSAASSQRRQFHHTWRPSPDDMSDPPQTHPEWVHGRPC